MMMPVAAPGGTTPIDMNSGTFPIPIKELLNALVAQGILDANRHTAMRARGAKINGYDSASRLGATRASVTISDLSWTWN
jgi:hypothetical protein